MPVNVIIFQKPFSTFASSASDFLGNDSVWLQDLCRVWTNTFAFLLLLISCWNLKCWFPAIKLPERIMCSLFHFLLFSISFPSQKKKIMFYSSRVKTEIKYKHSKGHLRCVQSSEWQHLIFFYSSLLKRNVCCCGVQPFGFPADKRDHLNSKASLSDFALIKCGN